MTLFLVPTAVEVNHWEQFHLTHLSSVCPVWTLTTMGEEGVCWKCSCVPPSTSVSIAAGALWIHCPDAGAEPLEGHCRLAVITDLFLSKSD